MPCQLAGMMFHSKPLPQFLFDQGLTQADVQAALDAFVYPTDKLHGTAIGLALDHVTDTILQQSSGARPDSPTMVFILTDGKSQEPDAVVAAAAQRLRDTGAFVIALGITPAVDGPQLAGIAGNTGLVLLREDFTDLGTFFLGGVWRRCHLVMLYQRIAEPACGLVIAPCGATVCLAKECVGA